MASAAEQLAATINFGAIGKATELRKRILFTLGCLIVFRLGTFLPLPGVDVAQIEAIFKQAAGGILGMLNMFAGGAVGRMSIFALSIMPYISASIIVQLMSGISPSLEALKKEGQAGRQKLNQYTRYLTVFLAVFQSFGVARGLEGMGVVLSDPFWFHISTIVILTAGTVFLMWLGEQITARGIGNGISLIIFSGIVANLPISAVHTLNMGATGSLEMIWIIGIIIMIVVVITTIVFFERAQRRLLVQYPKRQVGLKMFGGESSHLPLKLNSSGVIPPIFASSLLLLPLTVVGFSGQTGPGWLQTISLYLSHGKPLYMLLYAGLIIFFAFFYTAVVFNPVETADNLKKYGGFIPGYRPGKHTADYLDYVLTRLTMVGALYLAGVCLIPEFLISYKSLPFYFGGTSLLIVVSVTMDTVAQIHSHLIAHQYEGLIKKAKLKGRRG
ncbi:MAG TPA: preprotein translocase subunit SecY [Verrucomicrobiae bacterium]|nr:preprotein translocase subunit SecY [Verrucomicrobiae bacterium]